MSSGGMAGTIFTSPNDLKFPMLAVWGMALGHVVVVVRKKRRKEDKSVVACGPCAPTNRHR